jgi:septation ring formation regulator EzrA
MHDVLIDMGMMPIFPNVKRTKEQGMKILEEASECREAYEALRKEIEENERHFGEIEHMQHIPPKSTKLGSLSAAFVMEAADTLQAIANTLYAVYGEWGEMLFETAVDEMVQKNKERGRYGEERA